MNVEKLIEEIRKYPVLYDQSNEKYRNAEYKERMWKIIATTMGIEVTGGVDECKKKWASVRDQLRRTLQKRKTKSGQAAEKARKYKYEDMLTFLLPYLGEREGISNVVHAGAAENDHFEFGADLEEISSQETEEANVSNANEQPSDQENLACTSTETNVQSIESSSPHRNQVPVKKDKFAKPAATKRKVAGREANVEDSPARQLMAYILAEKEAGKKNVPIIQDPIDAFLCGIAPTLKSFDPVLQHEAKGRIFGVVQELELKQLQMQERYFTPNFLTSSSSSSSSQSSSSALPLHITIPKYSPFPSPSSVQSQSPSESIPSHTATVDETGNLERSYYPFQ